MVSERKTEDGSGVVGIWLMVWQQSLFLQLSFVISNLSGATTKKHIKPLQTRSVDFLHGSAIYKTISTYNMVVWSPAMFSQITSSRAVVLEFLKSYHWWKTLRGYKMGPGSLSYQTELKWTKLTSVCYGWHLRGERRFEHVSSLYANDRFHFKWIFVIISYCTHSRWTWA